jgi:predicted amidohydrolase YtcJ
LRDAIEASRPLQDAPCILILPPLWDHHGHIAALGALLEQADLRGCSTEAQALSVARTAGAVLPKGAWLEGFGWDQNLWGGQYPKKDALDGLFPDRPVLLRRVDGHAGWANSQALEIAGFGDETPDPAGGSLLRKGGRITGVLLDVALETVAALIPSPSDAVLRRRMLAGLDHLRDAGLSGVTDMGLEPSHIGVLMDLDREGSLPLMVEGFAWVKPGQVDMPAPHVGRRFKLSGVKLFADGALGSRGAALREPYSDSPGGRGLLLWEESDMARVFRECSTKGLVPAIHAIGDRAAGQVLDVLESASVRGARIEHAQILADRDVERMRELGVVAGLQPCHYMSDRSWAPARLGGRMDQAYRWGSLARAGVELLMGTDFPIEPPDPGRNFQACAAREKAQERLTVDQVIQAYAPPTWAKLGDMRTIVACGGALALASAAGGARFVRAGTGPDS